MVVNPREPVVLVVTIVQGAANAAPGLGIASVVERFAVSQAHGMCLGASGVGICIAASVLHSVVDGRWMVYAAPAALSSLPNYVQGLVLGAASRADWSDMVSFFHRGVSNWRRFAIAGGTGVGALADGMGLMLLMAQLIGYEKLASIASRTTGSDVMDVGAARRYLDRAKSDPGLLANSAITQIDNPLLELHPTHAVSPRAPAVLPRALAVSPRALAATQAHRQHNLDELAECRRDAHSESRINQLLREQLGQLEGGEHEGYHERPCAKSATGLETSTRTSQTADGIFTFCGASAASWTSVYAS